MKPAARRSIVVGISHLVMGAYYLIDGSPNDMNVGFWVYGLVGFFVLWPYQIVLALKLLRSHAAVGEFAGLLMSVGSLALTVGMW